MTTKGSNLAAGARVELIGTHGLTRGETVVLSNFGPFRVFLAETAGPLAPGDPNPEFSVQLAGGQFRVWEIPEDPTALYAWSDFGGQLVIS